MPNELSVRVNGVSVPVRAGATVAVAMAIAGQPCRMSVSGEPRAPLCGVGICFECRAVVNGIPHSRTCQILCLPNMEVSTGE
jgi:D-hydroxyproline dehydrogenase subunit gamma